MKEEYLINLKKEFNNIKEQQEDNKNKKQKLKELEANPIVNEYINLKKEVETFPREKTEQEIINLIYMKFHIKKEEETNGIYYCLGTFKRSSNNDEVRVDKNSKDAEYRVYANIESYNNIYKVPIKKCQEFEQEHPVIFSNSLLDEGEHEYFKLQKEFFLTSINEGQEIACHKILTRTKKVAK